MAKNENISMWHRWFSGRMLACHAGGPGSIPGRCKSFWTRIAGFKVQSANHYTIEPWLVSQIFKVGKDHKCLSHSMYSVNFVFCVQISYFADIISGLSWGKYDIWTKKIILFPAGFEPATLCVWSTRDNHYTKETHILQGGNCNW